MLPYTSKGRSKEGRESADLQRSCTYDLMSVVVHVGEIDTGHYVSYCRVGDQVSTPMSTTASMLTDSSSQWFKFNDHKVELATMSEVLGAQAYLLFYIIRSLA